MSTAADPASLWRPTTVELDIAAEELAERAGTIAYEELCGAGRRVPRTHVGG